MKIVAWTPLVGKRFSKEAAEKFFKLPFEEILTHVESGKAISVGIRDWYVDELLEEE